MEHDPEKNAGLGLDEPTQTANGSATHDTPRIPRSSTNGPAGAAGRTPSPSGTVALAEDNDRDSVQPESRGRDRNRSPARSQAGGGIDRDLDRDEKTVCGPESGADSGPEASGGPEAQPAKDPFEVTWDGGDADPLCPRSMGTARKWLIVGITSTGAACVTCASSIYTSSYGPMDAEFGNSSLVATLGLSMFVLGIAMGPAWSPLSEFYGRRPIYLGSFFLFIVWIIPSAVAKNIETMIVARFFQGFTGSAFLSVAGGTVGDLFSRENMQGPMALFAVAPFMGPSLGPLIGGFINSYANWRWTHYVMIIWSFCLLVALVLLVPETYHPVLLSTKARRRRAATGDDRWFAPLDKTDQSVVHTIGLALLRPFQLLVFEPMCLALDLYSAVLLGILYLFFGAFPIVFRGHHNFNLWQSGLSFMGLFVGMGLGGALFPIWTAARLRLMLRRQRATGAAAPVSEPEDRLPSVMVGSVLVPVGIFWFGWTSYSHVHWMVPIIGSGIFAMGMLFVFSGIFTFFVDVYQLYAASALAANAFVRCTFAAAFPLFGVQMYHKLGDQWASSLLAFLAVAMMPFPFLFFKYGKQLRARSRYAAR